MVCVWWGQVLFDELRLDEKCSKKLLKTQVQQQKSTSEAVVGSESGGKEVDTVGGEGGGV